jgi:hypothetical protein
MTIVTAIALLVPALASAQTGSSRWGACARFHAGHGSEPDNENKVPYDGDWSYGLVYEYREPQAMFQIIMSGAPNVGYKGFFDGVDYSQTSIDTVWTPEFNMIFTEGAWTGGMGVLKHLVRSENGGQWSPVFWQFLLGFTLGQRAGFAMDVTACYEFRSLTKASDMNVDQLDVRISLTKAF